MTTVQELTNGHRVSPLPCPFPDSQQETQSEDSPNNNFNSTPVSPTPAAEAFPANAYHVPPSRYAPKPDFRRGELPSVEIDTNPLPERCQFMFSDGRQCSMGRSEIHPSLCRFHSEREDQLFGDPTARGKVVGASLDLPELYSACGDLTTAAGVNRALALVFRLLVQRRISRQEAATFGHLAKLLLRTISLMRSESVAAASEYEQPMIPIVERQKGVSSRESLFAANVYLPTAEVYQQDELPPCNKAELRGAEKSNQELSRVNKVSAAEAFDVPIVRHPSHTNPPAKPAPSFRATIRSEESLSDRPTGEESLPHITRPSLDAPSISQAQSAPTSTNSFGINTSATSVCNSPEISTYENVGLKPVQNEHLQKSASEVDVRRNNTGELCRRR